MSCHHFYCMLLARYRPNWYSMEGDYTGCEHQGVEIIRGHLGDCFWPLAEELRLKFRHCSWPIHLHLNPSEREPVWISVYKLRCMKNKATFISTFHFPESSETLTSLFFRGAHVWGGTSLVLKYLSTAAHMWQNGIPIFLGTLSYFQTVAGNWSGQPCVNLSAWLYHIPYLSSVWLLSRWFFSVNGEQVASAIRFLSLSACFHFHSQGKALSRLLTSFRGHLSWELYPRPRGFWKQALQSRLLVTSALRQWAQDFLFSEKVKTWEVKGKVKYSAALTCSNTSVH